MLLISWQHYMLWNYLLTFVEGSSTYNTRSVTAFASDKVFKSNALDLWVWFEFLLPLPLLNYHIINPYLYLFKQKVMPSQDFISALFYFFSFLSFFFLFHSMEAAAVLLLGSSSVVLNLSVSGLRLSADVSFCFSVNLWTGLLPRRVGNAIHTNAIIRYRYRDTESYKYTHNYMCIGSIIFTRLQHNIINKWPSMLILSYK